MKADFTKAKDVGLWLRQHKAELRARWDGRRKAYVVSLYQHGHVRVRVDGPDMGVLTKYAVECLDQMIRGESHAAVRAQRP